MSGITDLKGVRKIASIDPCADRRISIKTLRIVDIWGYVSEITYI